MATTASQQDIEARLNIHIEINDYIYRILNDIGSAYDAEVQRQAAFGEKSRSILSDSAVTQAHTEWVDKESSPQQQPFSPPEDEKRAADLKFAGVIWDLIETIMCELEDIEALLKSTESLSRDSRIGMIEEIEELKKD